MISERIYFVIERITDILNIEKEKKFRYLNYAREWMMKNLRKELLKVFVYLRHVEQRHDEPPKDEYDLYYKEINYIAESCDEVVDSVTNYLVDVYYMYNLVKRVRNSYNLLPAPQHIYYFNIIGNVNYNGEQHIGNMNISNDKIKRDSRRQSVGHVPNSDFVGFNYEIETLLHHLIQPHNETHVIGIVGMGGAGKTTLAKQIYHHPQIRTHFTRKIWVCISQTVDKTSILKSIWWQATHYTLDAEMGYDQVVDSLSQHLSSESYLVILDDIWSIDAWNYISPGLPHNSGSKVVVTTRNIGVPKCIHPIFIIIEPKPLNKEESCQLFRRKTFFPNENIPDVLQHLGDKMVQKCKGLPLAITALAGILRMDKSQSSWERVNMRLAHSILHMEDASTLGVVNEVLGLSYYELPRYLKPCVLYLRLFPEDYVIKSKILIKMWIAECLIRTEEDDQISTAKIYLDELVQRCIIEVVKTDFKGQVSKFRIHDLIREMFVDINQKRGFLKDTLRLTPSIIIYGDDQNINSFSMSKSQSSTNLGRMFGTQTNSQVRSIILSYLTLQEDKILQRLFEKFRLLRVLIILHTSRCVRKMPEEIDSLIHLRYLELGGQIQLVKSIENLVNLWTLDMRTIKLDLWAVQINFNLCKLKELRHLYFPKNEYCWERKLELGRLKKLKTLCYVEGGEWLLSGMPVLSADVHELRIFILTINSKEQIEAVLRNPSITSNNLRTLELIWNGFYYALHDMNILSKCESLNKLSLQGAIKVGTPILFPPTLIKLEIRYTNVEDREVMNIISNSCPLLKILTLGTNAYMGSELVCNTNSFLQLEKLTLKYLKNLRLWIIEASAMPSLHHLTINSMKDMDVNPKGWTFISNIPQLTYHGYKDTTFAEKLRMYRKDDQNLRQSRDVYITNYHYGYR